MVSPQHHRGEATDPREILDLLRRRGWILLLCLVVVPLGAYVYTNREAKLYQSSLVLQVQSTAADDTGQLSPDFSTPQQNVMGLAALITTSGVADEASRLLGEPRGSLRGAVQATGDENTGLITLTASAGNGKRAAQIANAWGRAVGRQRTVQAEHKVDTAIARLQQDSNKVSGSVARTQLSDQLQRLRALRAAQADNTRVIDPAVAPSSPVSPHPSRNATLGLLVGLLLGIGLMLLLERSDRRIRTPMEIEHRAGVPLLATISADAFPGGPPNPHVAEGFQTLRDNLTYFNVDEDLKSLMVVSPLKGEGKTTVAMNLAVALARAGRRVVLVDADLRRPQIAARMGIEAKTGLSNVLAGGKLADALHPVDVFGDSLRVLPAGPPPPNPSELLGSKRMATLLTELERIADVIVIDTTPLLIVSDATPLLSKVSGAVALARLRSTPHDALERMLAVGATAGGRVLGVVATGARSATSYGYGYGYGYAYSDYEPAVPGAEPAASGNGAPNGKPLRERVRPLRRSD